MLLADDHDAVLDGVIELLAPEFDVVGVIKNGRALLDAVDRFTPHVVVVDIAMLHATGLDVATLVRERAAGARVVILTMHNDPGIVNQALEAGAAGYVLKLMAGDDLIPAIRAALEGRSYISPLARR